MSAVPLKIMSFNLRVDNTGDGINSFTNRFDRVVEVLEREKRFFVAPKEIDLLVDSVGLLLSSAIEKSFTF